MRGLLAAGTIGAVVLGGLPALSGPEVASATESGLAVDADDPGVTSGRWEPPGEVNRRPSGVAAAAVAAGSLEAVGDEVVEMRTARSSTFAVPSGGFETVVSAVPVHYRDGSGGWAPIDNRLVAGADGEAVTAAGGVRLRAPQSLASPVRVELPDGAWVSLQLAGAAGSSRVVDGASAVYRDVLDGVDVSWVSRPEGVKELVTLTGPQATNTLAYDVVTSPGLSVREADGGGLALVDADGTVVAGVPAPFAFDASHATESPSLDAFTDQVTMHFEPTASGGRLTVSVDRAWLDSPTRAWPVTVDPDLTLGPPSDCTIASGTSANVNYCADTQLKVGTNTLVRRSLLDFDVKATFDAMAPGGPWVIGAAELGLFQNDADDLDVSLHALQADWNRSCVSWNDHDECTDDPWATAGGVFDATPVEGATLGVQGSDAWTGTSGWWYWYPTDLVQGWLDGEVEDHGLLLKAVDEVSGPEVRFATAEDTDSARRPQLKIRWYRAIGMQPYWTYETVQLNPSGGMDGGLVLDVNVANGNLMVRETDQTLPGVAGLDVSLTRTFNWLATDDTALGERWFGLATARHLWSFGSDDRRQFDDPSGARVLFVRDPGDTDWTPTTETDLALSHDAVAGEDTVTRQGTGAMWVYAASGLLDRIEDRNGNTITFAYTTGGEIDTITDTRGRVFDFAYDANGKLASITDPASRVHQYTVTSADGWLSTYTDPDAEPTSYVNNGFEYIDKIVDPDGAETYFTYVGSSSSPYKPRISTIERVYNTAGDRAVYAFDYHADCTSADVSYDAATCTVVTAPDGDVTVHYPDASGRVTKTVDGLGRERAVGYTAAGSSTTQTVTMPGGGQSSYTYDTLVPSRVTEMSRTTDSAGTSSLTTTLDYTSTNNAFQPSRVVQPNGTAVDYTYDTTGRLSTVTPDTGTSGDPSGATSVSYTAVGQPDTVTNPLGGVTDHDYDTDHHLTTVTPPSGTGLSAESFTYDAMSRLTSHTDGRGKTTSYSYDTLDRLTQITYDDTSTVTFGYDRDNTREFMTDAGGTVDWGYNELGFLTRETLPDTTDLFYGYDLDGVMSSYTTPDGRVQFEVDDANQLTSVTWPDGDPSAVTVTYGYDDDGNRDTITYPGGVTVDHTYGVDGRIQSITATDAASNVLVSRAYDYLDPSGTDTSLVHQMTDHNSDTVDYGYDTLARLTAATASSSARSDFGYGYDAASNRTVETVDATSTYAAFDDANQLCWTSTTSGSGCSTAPSGATTFSYDGAGNLTGDSAGTSLSYNAKNQTTSITPAGGSAQSYSYQGPDQRRRSTAGSLTFVNSILDVLEQDDGTTDVDFIRRPDATLAALSGSQGNLYPIVDRLGSVIALTDDTGSLAATYTYTPYGQPETTTGSVVNPYRWIGNHGYQTDTTTGLHKVGMRYLDTDHGRWTQPDPSEQESNLYRYANCNPTNLIDPSGEFSWSCLGNALNPFSVVPTSTADAAISGGIEIAAAGTSAFAYAGYYGVSMLAAAAAGLPLIAAGAFLVGYGLSRC